MASMAASAPYSDRELSLFRLYVLRAVYLLIAVGEGSIVYPDLFNHEPAARGVMTALLSALCLLSLLGLKYPKAMLPLLLFETAWKCIWFFGYGLEQYLSGARPPSFAWDFPAITFGVLLMPFVIPWGYVWRHYVKERGDRWR